MPEKFLIAALIGICAEIMAKSLRLWCYRNPMYPVFNVLVMFGIVQGALVSSAVPAVGYLPVFVLGWGVGYAYEQLNFALLSWWNFPDERFLLFRGKQAIAASVGVLWGLVPVAVHRLSVMLT